MPKLFTVLRHPESRRPDPEPAAVDLGRVILIGTAVWACVLVGAVVARIAEVEGATRWIWVAVVGVALGGVGLLWSRRNRSRWQSETA